MSKPHRKTVSVLNLIQLVNAANLGKDEYIPEGAIACRAQRQARNSLLEVLLHETGNYRGFKYLTALDLPAGQKPGIAWTEGATAEHPQYVYPDDSRREYQIAADLIDEPYNIVKVTQPKQPK